MPTGGCLCGKVRYEFDGEPLGWSACHCLPCQRTSGQSNSLNFTVPKSKFRITQGTCKTFVRKGDSGKNLTYSFCGDCPGIITVDAEVLPDVYILKWGNLDDRELLDSAYPQMEMYAKHRFQKIAPYSDVPQKETT